MAAPLLVMSAKSFGYLVCARIGGNVIKRFLLLVKIIGSLSLGLAASNTNAAIDAYEQGAGLVGITWSRATNNVGDNSRTIIKETELNTGLNRDIYTSEETSGSFSLSRVPGTYNYSLKTCWITGSNYQCTPNQTDSVTVNVSGPGHDLGSFNTSPVVQITSPMAGEHLPPGQQTFSATVNDSDGVSKVSFYLDGVLVGFQTGTQSNYIQTYDTSALADGYMRLTVIAEDNAGVVESKDVVFLSLAQDNGPKNPSGTIPFDVTKYEVYYCDVDQSGVLEDIYLRGKDNWVLLHGEIITPIKIMGPAGFVFYGDALGRYEGPVQIDLDSQQLQNCDNGMMGTDYLGGDLDSDGDVDMLVRGKLLNSGSLVISGKSVSGDPNVLFTINSAGTISSNTSGNQFSYPISANLSDRNVDVSIGGGYLAADGLTYTYDASSHVLINTAKQNELAQSQSPEYASPSLDSSGQQALDQVKSLSGEFKVSEAGAANYTIPIFMAEGTAGVAPDVSLAYNSQAGSSALGIGWSLNVGGGISRCRQTLLVDKKISSISFSEEDRFCLNGQRLLVEQAYSYGQVGAKYRTEMESFFSVESIGGVSGAPDYFRVLGKDGSVSYYGYPGGHDSEWKGRNSSGVAQSDVIVTWGLSRFKDNVGNTVVYHYQQGSDHFRINEISYAYSNPSPTNIDASGTSGARVEFIYEDVVDEGPSYIGGFDFRDYSILEGIKTYNTVSGEEHVLREYKLGYGEGTSNYTGDGQRRLTSIRECVEQVCLPSLWFAWGYAPSNAQYTYLSTINRVNSDAAIGQSVFTDINGDGRQDPVYIEALGDETYSLKYKIQKPDGTHVSGIALTTTSTKVPKFYPLDVNADGRSDIALYAKGQGWKLLLAEPSVNEELGWRLTSVDQEVFEFPFNSEEMRFGDLNSDGLVDAFIPYSNQISRAYLKRDPSIPNSSNLVYRFYPADPIITVVNFNSDSVITGDVNGDGAVDYIGVHQMFSNEKIINSQWGDHTECDRTDKLYVGLADPNSTAINWQVVAEEFMAAVGYDTDQGCSAALNLDSHPAFGNILPVDINGDGVTDLVYGNRGITATFDANGSKFDKISYRIGKGDNTYGPEISFAPGDVKYIGAMDYESDGDVDLYFGLDDNTLKMSTWDQSSYDTSYTTLSSYVPDGTTIQYMDVTGDGSTDRVTLSSSNIKIAKGQQTHLRNQIVAFYSGHGAKTEVNYEPLSLTENYLRVDGLVTSVTQLEELRTVAPGVEVLIPVTTTSINSEEFYQNLNDPFSDLPSGTEAIALNNTAPILEFSTPMSVVTRVETSVPTYDPAANDVVTKMAGVAYVYTEAKMQAGGQGFLGFKELTTVDLQTKVVTTTKYRQDWPFVGAPLETIKKTADGHLLSKSTSTSKAVIPASLSAGAGTTSILSRETLAISNGTKALGPIQVFTSKTSDESYAYREGQASGGELLKVTEVETGAPDRYGNVPSITTKHINASGSVVSIQATVNEYFNTSNLPLGQSRLSKSTVTTTNANTGESQVRIAEFDYYGGSQSGCVSPGVLKGMLCYEKVSVNDESNDSLETRHYYDAFGNAVFKKMSADAGTRVSSLKVFDGHGRYINETYGVFSSHVGQSVSTPNGDFNSAVGSLDGVVLKTSEVALREKHGIPLQVHSYIGASNYLVSRTSVTPFGTPYFKASSDGSVERYRASLNPTNCPANSGAVYSVTQTVNDKLSGACFDYMNREVATFSKGFNGEIVQTIKRYDVLSRVVATSEPFESGGPKYWTEVVYDSIGRPVQTMQPFNTVTRTSSKTNMQTLGVPTNQRAISSLTYNGLEKIVTNSEGHIRKELSNVLGQTVKVTEVAQGASYGNRVADYVYDTNGNLKSVTTNGAANTTIVMTYNTLGHKTAMNDPDKGQWEYHYNGFGELVCQKDSLGNVIASNFDALGRLVDRKDYVNSTCESRSESNLEAHAQWVYDSAANGLGQLALEQDSLSGYAKHYSYDPLGRASETVEMFPGVEEEQTRHYQKVTYDAMGRVSQQFDSARATNVFNSNGTKNVYNSHGYLWKVVNAANTAEVYYEINDTNARGQVTNHKVAASVTVHSGYNAKTGALESINSDTYTQSLQSLSLKWDHLGNLLYRSEGSFGNGQERYEYDEFNQLRKTYFVNGSSETVHEVTYDAFGNIQSKTGMGSYNYSGYGPHAVSQIGSHNYEYDAAGNMRLDKLGNAIERTFDYTAFHKVEKAVRTGEIQAQFYYGTSRSRFKRVDTNLTNGDTTTTLYAGSVEKVYYEDGRYEWKRNIAGIGQITLKFNANGVQQAEEERYFLKDHLGSINAIVDESGMFVEAMAFDPWGARRELNSNTLLSETTILAQYAKSLGKTTSRGYTGHEMVDGLGIIHMNGRIYDAKMGRFLQADPHIQQPTAIGSLNRYSYVMNNPLNATDPTGFFFKKLLKFAFKITGVDRLLKVIAGNEILSAFISIALNFVPGCQAWCSSVFQAATTFAVTGSLNAAFKGFAISQLSMQAFSAIGASDLGHFSRSVAHGLVGGVSSVLQGGKFGHGFISAGLTKFMDVNKIFGVSENMAPVRVAAAAIIGGTISERTGGKFASGAITAAYGQLYNGETDARDTRERAAQKETVGQRILRLKREVAADFSELPADVKVQVFISITDPSTGKDDYGYMIDSKSIAIALELDGKAVSDIQIKATIFHETLHVMEARYLGASTTAEYSAMTDSHYKGHSKWITKMDKRYQRYLYSGGKRKLPDISKPNWLKY